MQFKIGNVSREHALKCWSFTKDSSLDDVNLLVNILKLKTTKGNKDWFFFFIVTFKTKIW